MTIYTTTERNRYTNDRIVKYWMDEAKANEYVTKNDVAETNLFGVTHHTITRGDNIETED